MPGKLITVIVVIMLTISGFGCKKKPAQPTPNQPTTPKVEVKSQAEYNEMAKKQITKENMQAELDKVEKEVQQEHLQ